MTQDKKTFSSPNHEILNPLRSPSSRSPSILHATDTVENLLWHGGISHDGSLWILPILVTLDDTLTDAQYESRLQTILNHDSTYTLLKDLGWTEIEWHSGSFDYPGLTRSIPLPSLEKVWELLEQDPPSEKSRAYIHRITALHHSPCSWFTFKAQLLQVRPCPGRGPMEALISADHHRIHCTPVLRSLLAHWLKFCQKLVDSEAEDLWVVWSRSEIHQMIAWDFHRMLDLRTPIHSKRTWSLYLKSRAKSEESIAGFTADPHGRLDDLSLRAMAESNLIENFNDQAPRSGDIPNWAILPHISKNRFQSFVDAVISISNTYRVRVGRPESISHRLSHGPRPLEHEFARWADQVRDPALKWAFATLLEWIHIRQIYRQVHLSAVGLSQALKQRYAADSLLQLIWGHSEGRSIDGEPAIIRTLGIPPTSEESLIPSTKIKIRLEPAIMRPACAATRTSSRAKRFSSLRGQYLSLSEWAETSPEASALVAAPDFAGLQVSIPQLKPWIAAEYLWMITANPGLFANTILLEMGHIDVDEDHPAYRSLRHTEKDTLGCQSDLTLQDAYDLLAWSSTMGPWPSLDSTQKSNLALPKRSSRLIDAGEVSQATIALGIRFETSSGEDLDTTIQSLRKLISSGSQTKQSQRSSQIMRSVANSQELFAHLGECLRFRSHSYFLVNQHEISEKDWFNAKKIGLNQFLLPSGEQVQAGVYEHYSQLFIARKKVLAKFLDINISQLWKVHRQVIREESQALPASAYLRNLQLQIAPILQNIDQLIIPDLIKYGLKPKLRKNDYELRPYQLTGIAWMYQRVQMGLGVCLADEMGLGKTVQAIHLIDLLKVKDRKALIIVPKSLVTNWQRECTRFTPHLRVGFFPETKLSEHVDIMITTYSRLRISQKELSAENWGVVILDEAQNIKNRDSQTTQAARSLKAMYRVALTGTPIENHAGEIWSLMDWLNPAYLGSQSDFARFVDVARSAQDKTLALEPLRACLTPILLRRLKDDPEVAISLPAKIYEPIVASLSPEQEMLYRSVLDVVLRDDDPLLSLFTRRRAYLKALLHLKQICNHPDTFYSQDIDQLEERNLSLRLGEKDVDSHLHLAVLVEARSRLASARSPSIMDLVNRSGKCRAFLDLILKLREQSSGILVFTQYRRTGHLLASILRELDDTYADNIPFLHGGHSAQERQDMIDQFSKSCEEKHNRRRSGLKQACPILILSLKAGGTGLNLTAADRVIHFDRWWNPAVEDQATDRAHRIGQEKTVFVYTLTTEGTIEASISKIFSEKKSLSLDILGKNSVFDFAQTIKDKSGFLDLVDPECRFVPRDWETPA